VRHFFLSALLAATVAQAAAQSMMEWKALANLNFMIDGGRDPAAKFYINADRSMILAVSESLGAAFVVVTQRRMFGTMNLSDLAMDDQAGVAITEPRLPVTLQGPFAVDEGDLTFDFQGMSLRIAKRPPLVGAASPEALFEHSPDYEELAREYDPKREVTALLAKYPREVEILVAFGVWCAHCKKIVPKVIKTLQVADNPKLHAVFTGVDETLSEPPDFVAKLNLATIPTVAVFYQGRELGRIVGEPKTTVEGDLAAILLKALQEP